MILQSENSQALSRVVRNAWKHYFRAEDGPLSAKRPDRLGKEILKLQAM